MNEFSPLLDSPNQEFLTTRLLDDLLTSLDVRLKEGGRKKITNRQEIIDSDGSPNIFDQSDSRSTSAGLSSSDENKKKDVSLADDKLTLRGTDVTSMYLTPEMTSSSASEDDENICRKCHKKKQLNCCLDKPRCKKCDIKKATQLLKLLKEKEACKISPETKRKASKSIIRCDKKKSSKNVVDVCSNQKTEVTVDKKEERKDSKNSPIIELSSSKTCQTQTRKEQDISKLLCSALKNICNSTNEALAEVLSTAILSICSLKKSQSSLSSNECAHPKISPNLSPKANETKCSKSSLKNSCKKSSKTHLDPPLPPINCQRKYDSGKKTSHTSLHQINNPDYSSEDSPKGSWMPISTPYQVIGKHNPSYTQNGGNNWSTSFNRQPTSTGRFDTYIRPEKTFSQPDWPSPNAKLYCSLPNRHCQNVPVHYSNPAVTPAIRFYSNPLWQYEQNYQPIYPKADNFHCNSYHDRASGYAMKDYRY